MRYADPAKKKLRTLGGAGDGVEKNVTTYRNGPLSEGSDIHAWADDSCALFCSSLASPKPPRKSAAAQPDQAQSSRSRAAAEMNHCQGVFKEWGERAE